ncbi:O-antigen ligase family protein [Ideonella sp.]|uniref:O-antigen ligase family protein n=1 Tax=Ideonella sp. TaxID=1929293 RepID=UPI0035B159BF
MTRTLKLLARVGIGGYLLLVPLAFVWVRGPSGHDAARMLQVLLMAMCTVAAAWPGANGPTLLPRTPLWRGVGLLALLLAGLSVAHAAVPGWAMREVALWLGMLVVAMTVAQDSGAWRWLGWAAVLGTLIYNVVALGLGLSGMLQGFPARGEELALGYNNHRFLNHAQTVALPLVAMMAGRPGDLRCGRALIGVSLVSGVALLMAVGGRATALALVLGSVAALLAAPKAGWRATRWLGAAAVAGGLLYALEFVLLPEWLGLPSGDLSRRVGQVDSVHARLFLWRTALGQVFESPWWGLGPMHFAYRPNGEAAHPHNIYLQIAAEWGVPMLLLLVAAVGMALAALMRRLRNLGVGADAQMGAALLVALVAALVDGGASGNFVMPVSQVWIAVAAGLAWRWWLDQLPPQAGAGVRNSRGWTDAALSVGAALLSAWLLLVSARDVPRLAELGKASEALSPASPRQNPRFWSSGWF